MQLRNYTSQIFIDSSSFRRVKPSLLLNTYTQRRFTRTQFPISLNIHKKQNSYVKYLMFILPAKVFLTKKFQ